MQLPIKCFKPRHFRIIVGKADLNASMNQEELEKKYKVCIIGLGYVGLPLAVEFGKHYATCGFDIDERRIRDIKAHFDRTGEVDSASLKLSIQLMATSSLEEIVACNFFIVTVPTPVDQEKKPDLNPLRTATELIGSILKQGDIVVFESTVYPGATEEFCVPILEQKSGLKFNKDFFCGYSPERINPGDKEHTLTKITKVVSGSTVEITEEVNKVYKRVVGNTFIAKSIRVAEAAKSIENAQRDINIAFVNELSKIFSLLHIDTQDVLEAASSKWNFLQFTPGLVGGHCIGVDPYYLSEKARLAGYNPEIILAGRKLNDSMGSFVADELIDLFTHKGINPAGSEVLILGITFKENCADVRNSKVPDIINRLEKAGVSVSVMDPFADKVEVLDEYRLTIFNHEEELLSKRFDGIILAVAHSHFLDIQFDRLKKPVFALYDVKGILPREMVDGRL